MAVYEVADIQVKLDRTSDFEDGVRQARTLFLRYPGCREIKLERCIEDPTRYLLRVVWDSVQTHVNFRAHEDFQAWRGLVGDCFAGPPQVIHTEVVVD